MGRVGVTRVGRSCSALVLWVSILGLGAATSAVAQSPDANGGPSSGPAASGAPPSAVDVIMPSFAPGTTAFSFSGGVSGDMAITTVACAPSSGADLSEPMSLDFTGTVDGATYQFEIGGYDITSGTFQLVPAGSGSPGLFLQTDPSRTDTRTFWGAPLRDQVAGAGGTVDIQVSETQTEGTVSADMTEQLRGIATPGGSIVHVVGAWSCPFPAR